MEFEPVCFACHRVMSVHTRDDYFDCLKDLSERLQKIMVFFEPQVKRTT